jgi:putative transposase
MRCFKSLRQARQFLSTHDEIANVFMRLPNQDTAARCHSTRNQAFPDWDEIAGVLMAASSCLSVVLSGLPPLFVSQQPAT